MFKINWVIILCIFCMISACSTTGKNLNEDGISLANQGKYEEALVAFKEAQKKDPQRFENYLNAAQVNIALHKYQEALSDVEEALKIKPEMVEISLIKAQLMFLLDKKEKANAILEKLAENNENHPQLYLVYVALGDSAFKEKEWEQSIAWYEKGIAINSEIPEIYILHGKALLFKAIASQNYSFWQSNLYSPFMSPFDFSSLNVSPAKASFRKALYIDDTNIEAHLMLATIAMQTKEYKEAQLELGEILKINDNDLFALMATSINERYLQNIAESKKYLDKALVSHPQRPEPFLLQAFLYIEEKKYENAIEQYLVIKEKFPVLAKDILEGFRINLNYYFNWLLSFVLHQDQKKSAFVLDILKQSTGQNFGKDIQKWQSWWDANGERKSE